MKTIPTFGKPDARTMTTSDGLQVRLRGVSLVILESISRSIEKKHRGAGAPVDPPVIVIEAAGGDNTEQIITQSMIEGNQKLALEFGDQWLEHQKALSEMQKEINERQARYMLIEGVAVAPDWNEGDWAERQEKQWGAEVPTDLEDRQIWYINTVLLPTQADQFEAGTRINLLTRAYLDEELVASAQELFRRPIRGAVRASLELASQEAEQMVAQSRLDDDSSGAPLGDAS